MKVLHHNIAAPLAVFLGGENQNDCVAIAENHKLTIYDLSAPELSTGRCEWLPLELRQHLFPKQI